MSLEVLLIPLGIAAIAAIREARSTDLCEKCKTTRIKDQQLLHDALLAMGATSLSAGEGRITGDSPYGRITFQRIGEVFLGRVDGANDQVTGNMLAALDMSVGALLQQRTIASLHARAAEIGMTLVSQTAANGEVQLVFEQAT
ncbi:hypothetical protein QFZ35_003923 [Arthrobacter ulcerisalmonis]|uniref:hypothetical protein n=1 Tax=Arthrobacter sp. B1I2 TaxID=3042263 RepID=UPI002789E833|nr:MULTISPECIES: hypothetical protein [Arthrobacter]MDQ0665425.1 hypothetical protein [Arthrobacter ulcerisalmonis]MDQ0733135.1 hypothetical protein [Arthrobacter sp. B1I2]